MFVNDTFLTITDTDLNNDLLLLEVLAEFSRRTAFVLAEQAVEVGECVEAAVITNLCHRLFGVYQQT